MSDLNKIRAAHTRNSSPRLSLILIALIGFSFACERDTKIEINDQIPPMFHLSGNGQLGWFEVINLTPGELSIYAPERVLWKIVPTGDKNVGRLPDITYGQVPTAFRQEIPFNDETPVSLEEEKPYQISAMTSEANTGSIVFIIRRGKIFLLEKAQDEHYYLRTQEVE